jgi:hypothetical protein
MKFYVTKSAFVHNCVLIINTKYKYSLINILFLGEFKAELFSLKVLYKVKKHVDLPQLCNFIYSLYFSDILLHNSI